jgi:hypothetical protein
LRDPEHLPLNERPLISHLGPQRRTGLAYDVDLARHGFPLRVRGGAFEGFPDGDTGTLAVARLDFTPSYWLNRDFCGALGYRRLQIQLGGAYIYDHHHHDPDSGEMHNRHGINLDLRVGYGGFWIEGELLLLDRASGGGLETRGFSVTAGAFLLPDFLEAIGRYEELHIPDLPVVRQVSGGLNLLYLAERFKMVYNFIYREEGDVDQKRHMIVFQLLL